MAEVEQVVLNREPHDYSDSRMVIAKFLPWCCCCCRGKPWYRRRMTMDKMNKDIVEGLGSQMDVIEILRWLRIFKFVSVL